MKSDGKIHDHRRLSQIWEDLKLKLIQDLAIISLHNHRSKVAHSLPRWDVWSSKRIFFAREDLGWSDVDFHYNLTRSCQNLFQIFDWVICRISSRIQWNNQILKVLIFFWVMPFLYAREPLSAERSVLCQGRFTLSLCHRFWCPFS